MDDRPLPGNDSAAASNASFSSGVETVTRTPSGWNGRTTTFWSRQWAANAAVRSPSATQTKLACDGGTV